MIDLFCKFPDKATAIQIARALTGNPELEEFSKDGWYEGTYYNIDVLFGTGELWVDGVLQPGYHINGRWCGPEATLPPALAAYRVYPSNPVCVFG